MKVSSLSFFFGHPIPERFAYGKIAKDGRTVHADNLNPHLAWTDVPAGCRSFFIACLDDDVPTNRDEHDARGEIPATQARRRFVHWVQTDIPAEVREIPEGALSNRFAAGFGRPGLNDYCRDGEIAMGETGSGYDGPCPPFWDARWHTYRFIVIALDVATLSLPERFTWQEAEAAMKGHVLETDEWIGIYSLNPRIVL